MANFNKCAVLLRLETGLVYGFEANIFIATVRLLNNMMYILKTEGDVEGLNFWRFPYENFTKVIVCHNQMECHLKSGIVFLGFAFREDFAMRSMQDFVNILRAKINAPLAYQAMPKTQPPRKLSNEERLLLIKKTAGKAFIQTPMPSILSAEDLLPISHPPSDPEENLPEANESNSASTSPKLEN